MLPMCIMLVGNIAAGGWMIFKLLNATTDELKKIGPNFVKIFSTVLKRF